MNWFRFYHDALDDPKVQRLEPALFKAWVNLLCLASKADERGCLPAIEDIGFALRVSDDEAARIVEELTRRGLIDDEECDRQIHNWHGRQRQSDDVTARVRKHRSGPTNSVTLHETETKRSGNGLDKIRVDTDTDTEQSREEPAPEIPPAAPSRSQSQPFDALLALCEATGADVAELSASVKSKQLGKAKQLLGAGMTVNEIGRCAGYLASEDWRTGTVDMFTVEKDRGKWELAGKPAKSKTKSRASPNGQPLSPQQRRQQELLAIANGESP